MLHLSKFKNQERPKYLLGALIRSKSSCKISNSVTDYLRHLLREKQLFGLTSSDLSLVIVSIISGPLKRKTSQQGVCCGVNMFS